MSSTAAVTSLSDDIQRALQHAVGNANDAASAHVHANAKHKKSKRQREEEQDPGEGEGGGVKKKKKSKKHPAAGESGSGNVSADPATTSASTTPEIAGGASGEASALNEQIIPGVGAHSDAASGSALAKKKKKNKGKERAQEDLAPAPAASQPIPGLASALAQPAAPPMDLATSSADFLSAVVAAASATAGQQPPGSQTFDQAMQQYMAYPDFNPYGYPGPPPPLVNPQGHPSHAHSALPGQPFPAFTDPTALLPDLNFASSEDLLRSLQEFDISKVVTVLKTLGEAAAAANVQLNAPPMFVPGPQPPQGLPVQQQQPVRSEAILGRPPKQKKGRGAGSELNAAPAPLQHDNPDHAHMLANVWMNPAKLAELVRTEGETFTKPNGLL